MLIERLVLRFHHHSFHPRPLCSYVASNPALITPFHSTPRIAHPAPLDMDKVNTTDRLAELRQLMKDHQVDIYSASRLVHTACWSYISLTCSSSASGPL